MKRGWISIRPLLFTNAIIVEQPFIICSLRNIGEATFKILSNSVEILSITAIALLLTKNYDEAIEYLKQVEKLDLKILLCCIILRKGYRKATKPTPSNIANSQNV